MDKEYFLNNRFEYTKPIKFIKDLINVNKQIFNVQDYNNIYRYYNKKLRGYTNFNYKMNDFSIQFFFANERFFIRNELRYFDFIMFKVVGRWIKFTKKRKRQRIGLKLLKPVSLHLGNPRFVDFNV
jgi:hypothetical protein